MKSYYHGDPKNDLLFWLCLPIILAHIAGEIVWAWVKTKMPHRCPPDRYCTGCGWALGCGETSLLCGLCQDDERRQASPSATRLFCPDCGWTLRDTESTLCTPCRGLRASKIKLFCCDVDLEYRGVTKNAGGGSMGSDVTVKDYRCPNCGRLWLYVTEWHKDSGRESDWYPQQTAADLGEMPDLYDERTRTKVYPQPFRLD